MSDATDDLLGDDAVDRESGFIVLHRQIMSSSVWALSPEAFKVWVALLLSCNWKPTKLPVTGPGGKVRELVVPRGSVFMGSRTLAERTGVDRKTALKALQAFADLGMVTFSDVVTANGPGRVVNVPNYDRFQSDTATEDEWGDPVTQAQLPGVGNVRTLPLAKARAARAPKVDPVLVQRTGDSIGAVKDAFRQLRGVDLDFDGRDAKALRDLLARNPSITPEEVAARWKVSLTSPRGTAKVATFVAQWNQYAGGAAGNGPRRVVAAPSSFDAPGARDFT